MDARKNGTVLHQRLRALRRRIRLLRAERGALAAGAAALVGAVVLALLRKTHLLWVEWHWLAAGVGGAVAVGWICGYLRRVTAFQTARAVEEKLALRERLSSAVALGGAADPMIEALVADAEKRLERRQPSHVFPRHFSREAKVFCVAALALVAALVVPELTFLQSPQRRAERAALREQGKRLVALARQIEKHPQASKQEIAAALARNMERLGRDMQTGRVDKRQALRRLDKLTRSVKQAQDQLAAESRLSAERAAKNLRAAAERLQDARLAEAMGKLSEAGDWRQLSDAQRQARAAQAARRGTGQQLLDLDDDLLKTIASLMQKEDFRRAVKNSKPRPRAPTPGRSPPRRCSVWRQNCGAWPRP